MSLPRHNSKKAKTNTSLNLDPKCKRGLKAQKPKPKGFPCKKDLGNRQHLAPSQEKKTPIWPRSGGQQSYTPVAIIIHQKGTEPPTPVAPNGDLAATLRTTKSNTAMVHEDPSLRRPRGASPIGSHPLSEVGTTNKKTLAP